MRQSKQIHLLIKHQLSFNSLRTAYLCHQSFYFSLLSLYLLQSHHPVWLFEGWAAATGIPLGHVCSLAARVDLNLQLSLTEGSPPVFSFSVDGRFFFCFCSFSYICAHPPRPTRPHADLKCLKLCI